MSIISTRDLPESARAIAEVIGADATILLGTLVSQTSQRRNRRIYVPQAASLTTNHRLVICLGYETARRLALTFGGEDIAIPNCRNAVRKAAIWRDFMASSSPSVIAEIATKYGVTERRIRQITAEERGELPENFHQAIGATPRTPERAAIDRLNGSLGGGRHNMIREILHRLMGTPETAYGATYAMLRAFQPRLEVIVKEDRGVPVSLERAVALMSARLPAEMEVRHGDQATLLILKPMKLAGNREELMICVRTPIGPKSMSQNGLVIAGLEALAVSAVIDRSDPKPESHPAEAA